jgi:tetratricopeptide (TPR) repeat protein
MGSLGARRDLWIGLLLGAVTFAVYAPLRHNDFVNYDDNVYITDNPVVCSGLIRKSAAWALTATEASNWHPLTWLSLELDAQLYGIKPWGFHFTNLLLHAGNVVLLYGLWRRMTGQVGASFVVAALFALHPLHVESVAWATERKDVLSTFFWLLTMRAYVRYAERLRPGRYLAVVAAFALGLLAKPMVVTLPFVLLLLDYWPLRRIRPKDVRLVDGVERPQAGAPLTRLLLEKVPLLLLAAATCAMTLYAQEKGRAVNPLPETGFAARLGNALVSYVVYVGRTLCPIGLAPFYPHPRAALPWSLALASLAVLIAVTAVAVREARRMPYLLVGWFWYLGTLVPVIGLVQAGWQASADRYTYIPLIGIFVMAAWTMAAAICSRPQWHSPAVVAAAVALCVCAVLTYRQIGYWRDSKTLWERALAVTSDNFVAHLKLADFYLKNNALKEAREQYVETLRLEPGLAYAYANLGAIAVAEGRYAEAFDEYEKAVVADPKYVLSQHRLAWAYFLRGDWADAEKHAQEALRLAPHQPDASDVLGCLRLSQGRTKEAVQALSEAVHYAPRMVAYHCDLAQALAVAGDTTAATSEYRRAFVLDKDWPVRAASNAWRFATDPDPAERSAARALQLAQQCCQATAPQTPPLFLRALAAALAESGQFDDAVAMAREALSRTDDPSSAQLRSKIENELAAYQRHEKHRERR